MNPVRYFLSISILLFSGIHAWSQKDTSVHYPISDRRGDPMSNRSSNPFDIRDTTLIKQNIEYDPITKQYYIIEKIGNKYYRKPTFLTFDEFWKIRAQQSESE